jgi:hypothetical protein
MDRGEIVLYRPQDESIAIDVLVDDFEGIDKFKATPEDKTYISRVFELGADGREHGIALIDDNAHEFASNLESKIFVPEEIIRLLDAKGTKDVKLYHNHPNGTAPSAADLEQLLRNRVRFVYTVGSNRNIHVVDFDRGILPEITEYEAFADTIEDELDMMLRNEVASGDISIGEANYIFAKEQAYRIARQYGWKYYGGRIDEIF